MSMIQVEKRDKSFVEFDVQKIASAIKKAFHSLNMDMDPSIIDLLVLKVTADFQPKLKENVISVEDIQDSVEKVLSETGYHQVSKAYILYRKQRENVRDISNTVMDYKNIVDGYLSQSQTKSADSNLSIYSVGGLILSNSGAITQNYWLHEVYDEQIAKAHNEGNLYIHDLDMLTGDSAGWSIRQFLLEGLGPVNENISSRPAKHLFALVNQLVNFLGIMQNEWAGAQSFVSFDTYLAPFVKADGLSWVDVHRCMETFIYGVNIPSRWGTRAPFSNICFDWVVPEFLADELCIVGGQFMDFTYGECQAEMRMIQRAFFEIMLDGDPSGHGFAFPIPTVFISEDFDFSMDENNALLFEVAMKYGTPIFAKRRSEDTWNLKKLQNQTAGLFAYKENMGSIGTVTINMPRIAYLSKDKQDFFVRLDDQMDIAARSLHVKRQVLSKFLESGLYPYTKYYIKSFDHHFSTIGLLGMNEAGLNASWLQADLMVPKTQAFCLEVLEHMQSRLIVYQTMYQEPFNLEATPAENVTLRFAKKDQELYSKMPCFTYYTNSCTLPVNATEDIFEALDIEEKFQSLYTGGTLFDVYLDRCLFDVSGIRNLVKVIVSQYNIPYFSLSPIYSVCEDHGYISGKHDTCPDCKKPCEVWSRVSGYYRPIQYYNEAKRKEFEQRKEYKLG